MKLFDIQTSEYAGPVPALASQIVHLVSTRGTYSINSAPKIVSPTIVYDVDGNYQVKDALKTIADMVPQNNYYSGNKEFSPERIADVQYVRVQRGLESWPHLATVGTPDQLTKHPMALLSYYGLVKLQGTEEFEIALKRLDFNQQGEARSTALEKLNHKLIAKYGKGLDLFSVPKKDVGSFAAAEWKDGFSRMAWCLGFGMASLIPRDRIAREASSLKNCEKFMNPVPVPFNEMPKACHPYVSMLRIAFIATEVSMLDSGDLQPSAFPKIACKLTKIHKFKDLNQVLDKKGQIVPLRQVSRAGIEVVHQEIEEYDETKLHPGTIRFVLPNGLKVNTQCFDIYSQAKTSDGKPVDLLLDYRSVTAKGGLSLLLMANPDFIGKGMTFFEGMEALKTIPIQKVSFNGVEYPAYVADIPVMRPGQRYIDFTKTSDKIASDMITKAILNEKFTVPEKLEKDYQELRRLANEIRREILL